MAEDTIKLERANVVRLVTSEDAAKKLERNGFTRVPSAAPKIRPRPKKAASPKKAAASKAYAPKK